MLSLGHNVLHLILILKLSTFPVEIQGNTNSVKFIRQKDIPSDYGLPDNQVVQVLTVDSLSQCAVVCMNSSVNNCQGFDVQKLKSTERKCRISATKLTLEDAVNIPNVRYYEAPELTPATHQPTIVTTPALTQEQTTVMKPALAQQSTTVTTPGMTQKQITVTTLGMTQKQTTVSSPALTQQQTKVTTPALTQQPTTTVTIPALSQQPTTVTTPAFTQQSTTLAPIVVKKGQMLDSDIDAGGALNIAGVTSYLLFNGLDVMQYTGPNFFGLLPTTAKISDFFNGVIDPLNRIITLRVYENGLKSIVLYDVCPEGYSKILGTCYKFFADVPKTYEDARQHCVGEGGMLAAIRNTVLLTALWLKTGLNEYCWVGVRDINGNDVWYFEDGTQVTDNTIWGASKPDISSDKDCAAAGYKDPAPLSVRQMNLEDLPCSNTYKFFCEKSHGPIKKTVLDLTSGFLPISLPTLPTECEMTDSVTAVVDLFPTATCLYFTNTSVIHNLHGALFKYTELVRTAQAYVTTKSFPITAAIGYLDLSFTEHVVLFFGKEVITLDWDNEQKKWV